MPFVELIKAIPGSPQCSPGEKILVNPEHVVSVEANPPTPDVTPHDGHTRLVMLGDWIVYLHMLYADVVKKLTEKKP